MNMEDDVNNLDYDRRKETDAYWLKKLLLEIFEYKIVGKGLEVILYSND